MVGRCFLQHAETMKSVYTEYCVNHDKAEQLLEKYDQIQVIYAKPCYYSFTQPLSYLVEIVFK